MSTESAARAHTTRIHHARKCMAVCMICTTHIRSASTHPLSTKMLFASLPVVAGNHPEKKKKLAFTLRLSPLVSTTSGHERKYTQNKGRRASLTLYPTKAALLLANSLGIVRGQGEGELRTNLACHLTPRSRLLQALHRYLRLTECSSTNPIQKLEHYSRITLPFKRSTRIGCSG